MLRELIDGCDANIGQPASVTATATGITATTAALPTASATSTTAEPRRGRPKRRPEANAEQREAVRRIFREIGKAVPCADITAFDDAIRPIRQEICWATGWHVWDCVAAAWRDVQDSRLSRIPDADRERIVIATQQGRERLGVLS